MRGRRRRRLGVRAAVAAHLGRRPLDRGVAQTQTGRPATRPRRAVPEVALADTGLIHSPPGGCAAPPAPEPLLPAAPRAGGTHPHPAEAPSPTPPAATPAEPPFAGQQRGVLRVPPASGSGTCTHTPPRPTSHRR